MSNGKLKRHETFDVQLAFARVLPWRQAEWGMASSPASLIAFATATCVLHKRTGRVWALTIFLARHRRVGLAAVTPSLDPEG